MPRLTRWFIRLSLVYLVLALLVAAAQALQPWWPALKQIRSLGPIWLHLFMVGWVTQLIFGVAYWMFPAASRQRPHGRAWLGWAALISLNLGLVLRAVTEPVARGEGGVWGMGLALAALLQWLAGLAFAANAWGRVRGR